jgi:hypothetical protein
MGKEGEREESLGRRQLKEGKKEGGRIKEEKERRKGT